MPSKRKTTLGEESLQTERVLAANKLVTNKQTNNNNIKKQQKARQFHAKP